MSNQVKTQLGSVKDKTETMNKSGIYAVLCQNCSDVYIGQTSRKLCIRCVEHYRPMHQQRTHLSTPADHMIQNGHSLAGFRLLKHVQKPNMLDAYEEMYIYRTRNASMNISGTSEFSCLYKLMGDLNTADIFKTKFE